MSTTTPISPKVTSSFSLSGAWTGFKNLFPTTARINQIWNSFTQMAGNFVGRGTSSMKAHPYIWIGGSLAAITVVAYSILSCRSSQKMKAADEEAQAKYVDKGSDKASANQNVKNADAQSVEL